MGREADCAERSAVTLRLGLRAPEEAGGAGFLFDPHCGINRKQ